MTPLAVTKRVYMDMSVAGVPAGRILVGLYGQVVPRTVENFATLASGQRGFGYARSVIHRVRREVGHVMPLYASRHTAGGTFTGGQRLCGARR